MLTKYNNIKRTNEDLKQCLTNAQDKIAGLYKDNDRADGMKSGDVWPSTDTLSSKFLFGLNAPSFGPASMKKKMRASLIASAAVWVGFLV